MPLRTPKSGRDFFLGLSTVWRRKWVPISGLCIGAGVGLAMLLLSVPQYRATAQILIGGGLKGNIATEQTVLESPTILGQVARDLNLYQSPYFAKPRLIDRLSVYGRSEIALQERIFNRLEHGLSTHAVAGASIIELSGRFPNPEMAARIVNATVDAYREQKIDEKFQASKQVGDWMGNRLEEIRTAAVQAQDRLKTFQRENSAEYQQQLNAEIAGTQKQVADLSARLNAKNITPTDLEKLSADLDAARQRLAALEDLASSRATAEQNADILREESRSLQASAASGQRLYEQFVLKYQEMMAEHEINLDDVRVISFATIPSTPDVMARLMNMLWLGLVGFAIGLAYVVARIVWARGFTTAHQLESMTGYPVFASIPAATSKLDAVHHHILQDPAAILAESLRTLRISLRLRGEVGRRPRTVAFTSTLPDEGKTSLSVMLATIAAKSGERVCVVDCDLRRPSLHKAFGIGNARGLADYLSDRLSLDEVIHRRDPSGVHLITGKSVPSYSLTLLTSGRMERLVNALREQYDLVILDAPSSLAFADARVLGSMVDQTLYVVNWNRTPRRSVLASLKNYADLGYEPLALVMNKVDLGEYVRDSASAVIYRYGHENSPDAKGHGGGIFAT